MSNVKYYKPEETGIIVKPFEKNGNINFYDLCNNRITKIPRTPRDISTNNSCYLGLKKFKNSERWVPIQREEVEKNLDNESFVKQHVKAYVEGSIISPFSKNQVVSDEKKPQIISDYDNWKKDQKWNKKFHFWAVIVCFIITSACLAGGAIIFASIIGLFGILFIWAYRNTKSDKETYNNEKNQKEQELKQKRLDKKRAADQEKKLKASQERDLSKKRKPWIKKVDEIEEHIKSLNDVEIPVPEEFKLNISKYESKIIDSKVTGQIQNFVKISNFLNDLYLNLEEQRKSISEDIPISRIRYRIHNEIGKELSMEEISQRLQEQVDFFDGKRSTLNSSIEKTLPPLHRSTSVMTESFKNEVKRIGYLEAMANALLIFLIEDKQVKYFEILEVFDKLGALDSSWQKDIQNKIAGLNSRLDMVIDGLLNLNDSFNILIQRSDNILSELQNIDSSIKTNNLLQAITAYQTYKINKNTKKLNK